MYRILAADQPVRERRNQREHPQYTKPELVATAPNQTWSWDITKLLGPTKWTYFSPILVEGKIDRRPGPIVRQQTPLSPRPVGDEPTMWETLHEKKRRSGRVSGAQGRYRTARSARAGGEEVGKTADRGRTAKRKGRKSRGVSTPSTW